MNTYIHLLNEKFKNVDSEKYDLLFFIIINILMNLAFIFFNINSLMVLLIMPLITILIMYFLKNSSNIKIHKFALYSSATSFLNSI